MKVQNPIELQAAAELYAGLAPFGKSCSSADLSPLQQAYRDFFTATLSRYGVDSPAELEPSRMSEFFEEIKEGWESRKAQLDV